MTEDVLRSHGPVLTLRPPGAGLLCQPAAARGVPLLGEGGAGVRRADTVPADRDGTTGAPEITAFVRERLAATLLAHLRQPVDGQHDRFMPEP